MPHQAENIDPVNPTSSLQDMMNEMKHLRQAAGDHITNTAADMADTAAKKTAEYLMDAAIQRIQDLFEQEQTNEHVQSCLNTLMRRFNEKSTITEAIEWYGRKTILQKAVIGILFVAGSALVGAVFNLSAIFALLSFGIFCVAETLLTEHYELTESQKRELAQDIERMEQKLFESVACLKEATKKLDDIFLSLLQQSIQSAHLLKAFEVQTSTLDGQLNDFLRILASLSETNTTLLRDHQRIVQKFELAHLEMERANATIAAQSDSIDTIGLKLESTNDALHERNSELAAIHAKFQDNLTIIGELEAGFSNEILMLKTKSIAPELTQVKKMDAPTPLDQRRSDTEAFLKKHNDLLETIRLKQAARKKALANSEQKKHSDVLNPTTDGVVADKAALELTERVSL